jgi:hypothetical protein
MPGAAHDLRGRRFGRLTIPSNAEPEIRNRMAYWPVVCDCGARKMVRGAKLICGLVVSCGWAAAAALDIGRLRL